MGYVEMEQGKYPEALVHYKEALSIARTTGDKEYESVIGLYISQLYDWMGEYNEAVKAYHEMRVHFEADKSSRSYGVMLINIGAVHGNKKDSDSALYYYDLALKYLPAEEDKARAIAKSNIAFVYMIKKTNYSLVRKLLDEARPVFEKYNSQSNVTLVDYYDAIYYEDTKDYIKARSLLLTALKHYKLENNSTRLSMVYDRLAAVYEKLNKTDSAFASFKLFKQFSDSVLVDLAQNNMSYQRVKFGMDKKQLEIESLEQKQTIQKEQLKREKTQRLAMYGGIVLLILFGAFMFNRFRVTQKQKKIIEEQKEIVEQKQKEVLDSIYYAKRIQKAHLPNEEFTAKKLEELKKKGNK
jgi:tetratricopeptide (TPR) repeat protein